MTSKEQVFYDSILNEFKEEKKHMVTLTEASRNIAGGKDFLVSDYMVFNFDCFNSMLYGLNPEPVGKAKEKTPDCLILNDGCIYFIEFKQAGTDKKDIRLKIHETILGIYNYAVFSKKIFSRDDFFNLKIKYILIKKGDEKALSNPFHRRIYISKNFYNLRSMNGFILSSTHVFVSPEDIIKFLDTVTHGDCQPLSVA
ncbi:hypothetical protein [Pantoea ananatis]|uniref:hypothetical protein n=1 Tax=Pantoea ananas TaxID=553 RepID=UPI0003791A6F|nr:hypothetical protein [Pantoea ananatis]MDR6092684.1 hypothetical protein [Pantoea ananatis]